MMASPLINPVGPAGMQIGNIQVPQMNVGLQVNPVDVNPAFQANAAMMDKLRFEEQKYQFQQKLQMDLMAKQEEALTQRLNASGLGKDSDYGLNPQMYAKDAALADSINRMRSDAISQMYSSLGQVDGMGRIDSRSYVLDAQRIAGDLQAKINNDPAYREQVAVNARRSRMAQQIQQAKESGLEYDPRELNAKLDALEVYKNDTSGQVSLNKDIFNINDFVFDRKDTTAKLDSILNSTMGERTVMKIVDASQVDSEFYQEGDALASLKYITQQTVAEAKRESLAAIKGSPDIMRMLRKDNTTPEAFVEAQAQALIQRVGEGDLAGVQMMNNPAAAARAKAAADIAKERIKASNKKDKDEFDEERGVGRFTMSTDAERTLNRLDNDLYGADPTGRWRLTKSQVEWINNTFNDERSELFGVNPMEHIGIDPETGIVTVTYDDGTPAQGIGRAGLLKNRRGIEAAPPGTIAPGARLTKEFVPNTAPNSRVMGGSIKGVKTPQDRIKAQNLSFNPGQNGLDMDLIRFWESARTGKPSSRGEGDSKNTGAYQYRAERKGGKFKGHSFGGHQFYGDNWNSFVDFLEEEGVVNLTDEERRGLSAFKEGNLTNNLDFIEGIITEKGEKFYQNMEDKFAYNTIFRPAIDKAAEYFPEESLTPAVRQFIADSANQHGGYEKGKVTIDGESRDHGVLLEAKNIIENSDGDLSMDAPEDVMMALVQARTSYYDNWAKRNSGQTSKNFNEGVSGPAGRYKTLQGLLLNSPFNRKSDGTQMPTPENQSMITAPENLTRNGGTAAPAPQSFTLEQTLGAIETGENPLVSRAMQDVKIGFKDGGEVPFEQLLTGYKHRLEILNGPKVLELDDARIDQLEDEVDNYEEAFRNSPEIQSAMALASLRPQEISQAAKADEVLTGLLDTLDDPSNATKSFIHEMEASGKPRVNVNVRRLRNGRFVATFKDPTNDKELGKASAGSRDEVRNIIASRYPEVFADAALKSREPQTAAQPPVSTGTATPEQLERATQGFNFGSTPAPAPAQAPVDSAAVETQFQEAGTDSDLLNQFIESGLDTTFLGKLQDDEVRALRLDLVNDTTLSEEDKEKISNTILDNI